MDFCDIEISVILYRRIKTTQNDVEPLKIKAFSKNIFKKLVDKA